MVSEAPLPQSKLIKSSIHLDTASCSDAHYAMEKCPWQFIKNSDVALRNAFRAFPLSSIKENKANERKLCLHRASFTRNTRGKGS